MSDSSHGGLDPARWRRVRELFDDVVECDPAERPARLDAACAADLELRHEVESLLAHADAGSDRDTIGGIITAAPGHAMAVDGRNGVLPAPVAIGHYHILEKLGEGGMGEVFLAEDTTLGRRIALKLPAAPLAGDAEARARLLREARAAATLNHPHVCVVHEVGEGPDGGRSSRWSTWKARRWPPD